MDILIIGAGITLAILFNFVNGLNDAANSIATIIATRALSPLRAVLLASFFNLCGPLLFSTAIAKTIGKGIVGAEALTVYVLFISLIGAVLWVFITSMLGIPVSSSHALVGGLLGAGIAAGGVGAIIWPSISNVIYTLFFGFAGGTLLVLLLVLVLRRSGGPWGGGVPVAFMVGFTLTIPLLIVTGAVHLSGILAIIIFIVVSPMLGLIAAYFFGLLIMRLSKDVHPSRLNKLFRPLQIAAGSFQAIGHGSNDAQNAMGVITAMLVAGGLLSDFVVPLWVILISCLAISLGTLLGGWRVVDKMAHKITKIRPYQGFDASMVGGGVLSLMTAMGVPVSTTHAMSGAIMGAGATRGYTSAVKWGIVREIAMAWVLTIPASAMVSWVCFNLFAAFYPL